MKNAFDFDFFLFSFPSFWWSRGGYGSATVTGRFSFFFDRKLERGHNILSLNCNDSESL
jgi:hypothetical protein